MTGTRSTVVWALDIISRCGRVLSFLLVKKVSDVVLPPVKSNIVPLRPKVVIIIENVGTIIPIIK